MSMKTFRERLRTVQLVPITPYDSSGELSLATMRKLIRRTYDAGIRVFIPCAGSAEFDCLSSQEIVSMIRAVREEVGSGASVMCPVGRQVREAIRLGKDAIEAGADCILVMPLAHSYVSNPGAKDYFRTILDGVGCPTLLYKKSEIPSDELLLELAEHPNLVGIKYAVNDVDAFNRVIRADKGRVDWYCGSAERFSPFFTLAGSPGYTSGAGSLVPRTTLAMHKAMAAGDWDRAMRLQQVILPIEQYRARGGGSYNISFLKYAIKHIGLEFGPPRAPNRQLTEAEMREIEQMMPNILRAESELA
jgi:4-hydroxy-tetrahydrodipicolinate synthase